MANPKPEPVFTTLQTLMWPDPDLYREIDIALRLAGPATLSATPPAITFAKGAEARFDTAFNLFPLAKWQAHCGLTDLWLRLEGSGAFSLTVACATVHATTPLLTNVVTFDATGAAMLDLSTLLPGCTDAVLVFSLLATGDARVTGAAWQTLQAPRRDPKLVLGITTFKREAAVMATAAKFAAFAAQWPQRENLHLVVVDNGQTVTLPAHDSVTLVANRNLGGSGGFARCLHEAFARGASHALFMDDDAFIDMQAIARVWAFLAYAADPATSVIGGLTQAANPGLLWESGATFHQICRPLFAGLDLTSAAEVIAMECAQVRLPNHTYGGFWFFAFPLASVRHWPFPFFIRGDDIAFSLSNPFRPVTLPGVASFQDQDFTDKESALIVYLELRNHMIQHLALPDMAISAKAFAFIPMVFFARSLLQMHLDSLAALNLAVEDVLRGPSYFATHVDLAARRAEIAGQSRFEVWEALDGAPPKPKVWINPDAKWPRLLMKLTLNGLLLPFFAQWGNRLVVDRNQRGRVRPCWGAAQISYVDVKRQQIMTVRHRKWPMFTLALRSAVSMVRLMVRYGKLRAQWQAGFGGLTSAAFWQNQFFPDQD